MIVNFQEERAKTSFDSVLNRFQQHYNNAVYNRKCLENSNDTEQLNRAIEEENTCAYNLELLTKARNELFMKVPNRSLCTKCERVTEDTFIGGGKIKICAKCKMRK